MSVKLPRIPSRIARLPVDDRGYPVPWFVYSNDGQFDFRVIGPGKLESAVRDRLCWVCGEPLDKPFAFVIGPMCAVNQTIAEPPSHLTCAEFAAKACPFLTKPKAQRREANMPAGCQEPAGFGLRRNPGACCLWICSSYSIMQVGNGVLFKLPDPEGLMWFAEGRTATRAEVVESMETGLPFLMEAAREDGPHAVAELQRLYKRAHILLPRE